MKTYVFKCVKCNKILDDNEEDLCEVCFDKEHKEETFAKNNRIFKRQDNHKITHRTKKRNTKPRKEVDKTNE